MAAQNKLGADPKIPTPDLVRRLHPHESPDNAPDAAYLKAFWNAAQTAQSGGAVPA